MFTRQSYNPSLMLFMIHRCKQECVDMHGTSLSERYICHHPSRLHVHHASSLRLHFSLDTGAAHTLRGRRTCEDCVWRLKLADTESSCNPLPAVLAQTNPSTDVSAWQASRAIRRPKWQLQVRTGISSPTLPRCWRAMNSRLGSQLPKVRGMF